MSPPLVNGNVVTFPTDPDSWYQVQTPGPSYTEICQGAPGTTCTVTDDGEYYVIDTTKIGVRWLITVPNEITNTDVSEDEDFYVIIVSKDGKKLPIVIPEGGNYMDNEDDDETGNNDDFQEYNNNIENGRSDNFPDNNNPIAGFTIDSNNISWSNDNSSDYYQVENTSNNTIVCSGFISSCDLDPGTYHLVNISKNLRLNHFVMPTTNNCATVGSNNVPNGYSEIFRDDFCGEIVSPNFFVPSWGIPNRATEHRNTTTSVCEQKNGILELKVTNVGKELHEACYLLSRQRNFGPGDNSTLKIEYRANVSEVKADGIWFAGWLYPEGTDPVTRVSYGQDNKISTGIEYDVFEYLAVRERYQIATHDPESYDNDITEEDFNQLGIDVIDLTRNEYHTFAMEWNKDCLVFSIDGHVVDRRTTDISKAKSHNIYLTMEGQSGTQWGYLPVGDLGENLNDNNAIGRLDWVRVMKKDSIDQNLCN